MDISVRKQEYSTINIVVPIVLNTGAPDTGATITVAAINPDGTQNTTFTSPSISEVISSSGVYLLSFGSGAANKLFTLEDQANPYTVLVKSATSGSTGYRAVRVYCTARMPSDIATATALSGVTALVDALPLLSEMEASTILAKSATVTALPTLSQIEASTVLAKQANIDTLLSVIRNKKVLRLESGTYYLCVRNSSDTADIMKKALKDVSGADITAPAAGIIAQELASSI